MSMLIDLSLFRNWWQFFLYYSFPILWIASYQLPNSPERNFAFIRELKIGVYDKRHVELSLVGN